MCGHVIHIKNVGVDIPKLNELNFLWPYFFQVYIDYIEVKSMSRNDHVTHLQNSLKGENIT